MISVHCRSQKVFALAFFVHPQLRDLSSAGLWHWLSSIMVVSGKTARKVSDADIFQTHRVLVENQSMLPSYSGTCSFADYCCFTWALKQSSPINRMGWFFTHWRAELQNAFSMDAEVNMTWKEAFLAEILTYGCYPDKPHRVRAISWTENSGRQKEYLGEVSNPCHALAFPSWQFLAAGLCIGWFVCLPRVEHKCNPQLPLIMLQSSLQLIEFQGFAQRSLEPHFGKTSGGLLLIQ